MTRSNTKLRGVSSREALTCQIGCIMAIDAEGRAIVTFPGGGETGVVARSALEAGRRSDETAESLVGSDVVLAFQNSDPSRPIIVGLVHDAVRPEPIVPEVKLDVGGSRDVLVDGRRLVIDAHEEILLRCGKSTVLLRRDGKVLIRGAHLVSRSSGPNKIKGGSISLN
jgi:hypothetical protein